MLQKGDLPRILVAPGPYKECLDARDVATAMKAGIEELLPDALILMRPMADGGSGFSQLLTEATGGRLVDVEVSSPLGVPIRASFGILGDNKTAVIESAKAAGLALIPTDLRNPMLASTYGVGQLIAAAVNEGAQKVILGCGDSGTNDCGIGCAAALGVEFFDASSSKPISRPTAEHLGRLTRIDTTSIPTRFKNLELIVACNLTSILCGPEGTSLIYGPQKGATPEQIEILHRGVNHFCDLVFGSTELDIGYVPGAGGSGGLAASLYAFFGARLLYSLDVVDSFLQLDRYFEKVDLVLTGEGCIDDRTATGKIACGIALKAKKYGLPVVAIVGSIASDYEDIFYNGIDAVECIAEGPITREESIKQARRSVAKATERVVRFMLLRQNHREVT